MEDLGEESNLGRSHGVVVWEEELELENAALHSESERFCLLFATFGLEDCFYVPSYGDDAGPWISTSKYRRLSS